MTNCIFTVPIHKHSGLDPTIHFTIMKEYSITQLALVLATPTHLIIIITLFYSVISTIAPLIHRRRKMLGVGGHKLHYSLIIKLPIIINIVTFNIIVRISYKEQQPRPLREQQLEYQSRVWHTACIELLGYWE